MRQMNLRISLAISIATIILVFYGITVLACPPAGYPVPIYDNRCGQYGCVEGKPAMIIPQPVNPPTQTIITIIRK